LLEPVPNALREAAIIILEKRRPASNEKSQTAGFFMFLLDHDPLAVRRGLDGIDTYGTLAQGQRNALQVSDLAGMIRKNREVQVISSVIELTLSEIHNAPPVAVPESNWLRRH
jgi:hypothetical protein